MELRLYSFVNFYLSSIQQGIQTGHAAVRLVRKYAQPGYVKSVVDMANEWADRHETFIILNGGDYENICKIRDLIYSSADVFPFCEFYESRSALNSMLTSIAIVLPETIFNVRPEVVSVPGCNMKKYVYVDEAGEETVYAPGHRYYEFIDVLKSCRLAQ